jgi:hypothetical protein
MDFIVISSASRLVSSSSSLRFDLQQIRDRWFLLLLVCTGIVVLGVILEEAELWLPSGKSRVDMAKGIPVPSHWHKWKKKVARIGWILIILGVVGEGLFEAAVSSADGMLQNFNDTLLASAIEQAGDAATSAKTAHDEADAIKREADAIQLRLSMASKQLTVIEDRVRAQGPRWLILANNAAEFIRNLKAFASSRITVLMCGGGVSPVEQLGTEQRLLNLLGKPGTNWAAANWETGYEYWTECPNTSSNGLEMAISGNSSEGLKKAANALRDQLLGLGIAASVHIVPAEQEQFWAAYPWGPDSPEARAARDPTTIFLLVAPNAMVDAAKPNTKMTKQPK